LGGKDWQVVNVQGLASEYLSSKCSAAVMD
jgi:hypothetical protein